MNIKFRKKHSGFGVIGWIVIIPLLIIVVLILTVGFYEGRKAYWDHKVKEMCEKDGDVAIYEKFEISSEEYTKLPKVNNIATVPAVSKGDPVFSQSKSTYLHRSNPEVRRTEVKIIRKQDENVIARYAMYSRVGGDFPTIIGHPTYFSCPDTVNIITQLGNIFVIKGETK